MGKFNEQVWGDSDERHQWATTLRDGSAMSQLPGAQAEAKAIGRMLRTPEHRLLTGDRATRAAVLEHLPDVDLLHLATHGVLNEVAPHSSSLALAGSDHVDVADLVGLSVTTKLVVLSGWQVDQSPPEWGGPAAPGQIASPTVTSLSDISYTRRWADASAEVGGVPLHQSTVEAVHGDGGNVVVHRPQRHHDLLDASLQQRPGQPDQIAGERGCSAASVTCRPDRRQGPDEGRPVDLPKRQPETFGDRCRLPA